MVTVNCFELSKKAMESVKTKYPYTFFWIANGCTDETIEYLEHINSSTYTEKDMSGNVVVKRNFPNIRGIINPQTSGLSGCWNMGIQAAFDDGCDYVLVMNNDIVLSPSTIDNLVKRMEKGDAVMVTAVNVQHTVNPEEILTTYVEYKEENDNEHPDFSCFMISEKTIEKVGWFDENYYVAYFEDNDMHGRIAMLGEKAITIACAPYHHYGSQTSRQNPHLRAIIEEAFIRNREYFCKKFGYRPAPLSDVPEMREKYLKTPYGLPGRSWKDTTIPVSFIPSQKPNSEEELPKSVSEPKNGEEGSSVQ